MKTWTANFTAKVEKQEGEQTCFLVHINYGTSGHLYLTNADQEISLGGNTYYPYILSFGSLSFEMPEEDVIDTVANLDIQIMRNATTDVLLNNLIRNRIVEIWQYFIGLADADKVALATLIIDKITESNQSSFILSLKSQEFLIREEIPFGRLNKTNYPYLPEDNLELSEPIVFGKMQSQIVPLPRRKLYFCHKNNGVPARFVDQLNRTLLISKLAGNTHLGQGATFYTMEYESQWDFYSFLEDGGQGVVEGTKGYSIYNADGKFSINLSYPLRRKRKLYIMPDTDKGAGQNPSNWRDACDQNANTNVVLSATLTTFSSVKAGLSLNSILLNNADVTYKGIGFRLEAKSNTDMYAEVFLWWVGDNYQYLGQTSTIGDNVFNGGVQFDLNYPLSDYWIEIRVRTVGASGNMTINDMYAQILYDKKTDEDIDQYVTQISTEMGGINTVIQPGSYVYQYDRPIYIIYAMLNKVCGIPASEIDATTFDSAYLWHNGLGYTDNYGGQVFELREVIEYLREIFIQCNSGLFKSGANKYSIFKINKAETPITVFRDLDMKDVLTSPAMVYQMTDFKFYQNDKFYNKFILNYHYDNGRQNYSGNLTKDRNNDSDLNTSYINHGNEERILEVDCNWIQNLSQVTSLYAELKKYWKQTKLIVEFDTNLVGTKLELGDTIRTNHKAQTWSSNAKDFQVIGLEQDGNVIHIKAIEIML